MRAGAKVVIGVGGNIGAGKTTVARVFKKLGARYISADEIGWTVLPVITKRLKNKFGKQIMRGMRINKQRLRELAFSDVRNLEFLNRVSHPILIRRIIDKIRKIKSGIVVVDAALLFDWPEVYAVVDYPIMVRSRPDKMSARVKNKGINESLFKKILSLQQDEKQMATKAAFVIDNNGTVKELEEMCRQIFGRISDDC
jgi:dephospho-CoA kinase